MSKKSDELVATAPDQVYCWDITYLKRNALGTFSYLYLATDIFQPPSRVGARVRG